MINDEIAVKIATIEKSENLTVLEKSILDKIADQLKMVLTSKIRKSSEMYILS